MHVRCRIQSNITWLMLSLCKVLLTTTGQTAYYGASTSLHDIPQSSLREGNESNILLSPSTSYASVTNHFAPTPLNTSENARISQQSIEWNSIKESMTSPSTHGIDPNESSIHRFIPNIDSSTNEIDTEIFKLTSHSVVLDRTSINTNGGILSGKTSSTLYHQHFEASTITAASEISSEIQPSSSSYFPERQSYSTDVHSITKPIPHTRIFGITVTSTYHLGGSTILPSRVTNVPSSQVKSLLVTLPPRIYNEAQYFVSIKSDDCPKIKTNKFDHELTRALAALGVLNVSANIARTKCRTQLSVNITAVAPQSAIKLLEKSRKRNITITVFNRTFKIIDIQQLSGDHNETETTNSSTTVVNVVAKNEFNAYVAVGACFGLVLLVSVSVCCIKCWSKDTSKRMSTLRNSHSPLSPEDYTLTPLPRPTSLYVDYYRNSFSPDMRSTTSAGSVGSTSPTGEKVVQPFDTSIVPLEDFVVSTITDDSRRNSIESAITQKSATHLPGANQRLMYLNSITNSREKLNPRFMNGVPTASGGVSNPTYQRY